MPSPHLERKLEDMLGDDAGAEVAAMIDRIDPIRGDIAELRHTVRGDIAELRHEMRFQLQQAVTKQLEPVQKQLDELTKEVHAVDKRIGDKHAQLLIGLVVAAMAGLARVLRP